MSSLSALATTAPGTAKIGLWHDELTPVLHEILRTVPPPASGEGGFRAWCKSVLAPRCTDGHAPLILKFMPQTLFHKVKDFYGASDKENREFSKTLKPIFKFLRVGQGQLK